MTLIISSQEITIGTEKKGKKITITATKNMITDDLSIGTNDDNKIIKLKACSSYTKGELESLAEKLEKEIDKFSNNSGQVDYLNFESIDLISFVISDL